MPRRIRVSRDLGVQPPEDQIRFMRLLPARRGYQQRLAAIPAWDGKVRFPSTGDNRPWSSEAINAGAWEAMRGMAAGLVGTAPLEKKNDPNDPPAVGQDIRSHPHGPWGPAPGYHTYEAGARAHTQREARLALHARN